QGVSYIGLADLGPVSGGLARRAAAHGSMLVSAVLGMAVPGNFAVFPPNARRLGGDFIEVPARGHTFGLLSCDFSRRRGIAVLRFEQKPVPLVRAAATAAFPHQHPSAAKFL